MTSRTSEQVVWVRRCTGCGMDDLSAACGRAELFDHLPWRCPSCGVWDWRVEALLMPETEPSAAEARR